MPDPVLTETLIPSDPPGPTLHTLPGSTTLIWVKRTVDSAPYSIVEHSFSITDPTGGGSSGQTWNGTIYQFDSTDDRLARVKFVEASNGGFLLRLVWAVRRLWTRLLFSIRLLSSGDAGSITVTIKWRRNGTGTAIAFEPVSDLDVLFEP